MGFQGGIKAAAKLLAGLSKAARDKVLETISKSDPQMAKALEKSMYTFEDLVLLTPMMVNELINSTKEETWGLALRNASPDLRQHLLSNIPRLKRSVIEEVLNGPPQLLSKVEEAQEMIMESVLKKIEKGQIILDKESSSKLV